MANPDLEDILNALLPFAQQMLAKNGEFYPFGSYMKGDGKIIASAHNEGHENPPSQQVIDSLTKTFRLHAMQGQIRAAGICFDSWITPPGKSDKVQAICLSLEHKSGDAIDVCLPYDKNQFGNITYGNLFSLRRNPQFFSHP